MHVGLKQFLLTTTKKERVRHETARVILDQQSNNVAKELIRLAEDFEEVLEALKEAQEEIKFWKEQTRYWIERAKHDDRFSNSRFL